jgi:hypothetical protein
MSDDAVKAYVMVDNVLNNSIYMKSLSQLLFVGVALATLSLTSDCSLESSQAQSATPPPPSVSTPVISVDTGQTVPALPVVPAVPPAVEKPATIPPSIAPTSPLAQVVRLAQAGVDEGIIMVYVTNSSRTFNLDSDKIIYLTDLGLPTDVVTAMMQHDLDLQQQFAASQAAQQAQLTQPAPPDQTAVESAQATTNESVEPPAPVTANYFYDTLSPYGSWVTVSGYGSCWRPAVCTYSPGWQPYCNRGRWVYTDCGWYWSSDYAWGATFHYGRWFQAANVGWCWSPDTVWAPSWVTWRYSNNYCGWAPLPPGTYCQPGVGIAYRGGGVSIGLSFGLAANCFTFVPTQNFCSPHPRNYCVPRSQVALIYNNTTVINNIRIHGSGHNQIVINNGIPVQGVVNQMRTPIRPVPVREIDNGFARGSASYQAERPSRVSERPGFLGNSANAGQAPGRNQIATGQNSSRPAPVTAGNGITRPEQNRPQSFGSNQNQPVRQEQFKQGQNRLMEQRDYSSTTTPQRTATANNNYNPQTAPNRGQQQVAPGNYTRTTEPRQNYAPQNRVVAPPATYSAPAQPQPQARSYSQPRVEVRQNYSPATAVSAPQPQRSQPNMSYASAPAYQGGGRPNWGQR